MFDIPEWFRKEGSVVKGAPGLFTISVLLAAAIVGTGIYWFVDHLYSAQLQAKDATIQRSENDRDSYKENWDESKQEIARLRAPNPSMVVTQYVYVYQTNFPSFYPTTNLFIHQTIATLIESNNALGELRIGLWFKPIPHTVFVELGAGTRNPLDILGVVSGDVLVVTNGNFVPHIRKAATNNTLIIDYVRDNTP